MIRQLIVKILCFSLPVVPIIVIYILTDPFKVLKHYDYYYESGGSNYVTLNKGYVSTQNFLNRYPAQQYENFIMGNSRSIQYKVSTWSKLIGQPIDKCYHLDASGENIYGIAMRVKFLDKRKVSIKNVLIVIDQETLIGTENQKEFFRRKHPLISGENKLAYQYNFFKSFFNYAFLKEYIPVRLFSAAPNISEDGVLKRAPVLYNAVSNEVQMEFLEEQIHANAAQYYNNKKHVFYKRNAIPAVSKRVIRVSQLMLLKEMKTVFDLHNTNYKIIISPLYDQVQLAKEDLHYLQSIFGEANVYDFSGKNSLTEPVENFYESSHYRPHVADTILNRIYKVPNE